MSNQTIRIKNILTDASKKYQLLLQQTHDEALTRNEVQIKKWEDYRKEHEELCCRLLTFRDSLTHEVMVPLGKKALMRGQLVHTNEILVSLGDGWFANRSAKQAVDICQRRIKNCDEMLKQLNEEKKLLTSRKSIPLDSEAFSGGETQELIEPYDEEEERKWRERHRQKEKEYRQKLAKIKQSQKTKIETEEDLWKRLDALDEQEEIEDEINRLSGGEEDIEESEDDSSHEDDPESEPKCDNIITSPVTPVNKDFKIKRKVSFKESQSENNSESTIEDDSSDENMFRIVFKHSENPPATVSSEAGHEITSPAELYRDYLLNRLPKSILKKSSSFESYTSISAEPTPKLVEPATKGNKIQIGNPAKEVVMVNKVVETPSETPIEMTHRPVSRFKAARLASKR